MKHMIKAVSALVILAIGNLSHGQVIIGDDDGTATDKTSVLLEFANLGNRGIILPYVTTLPPNQAGTIVLDAESTTAARVKYNNGTSWVDLSGVDGDITQELEDMPQPIITESGKVIIGDETSDADGVLVLESTNKAMVLPIVDSTDAIPDPSAGMMVYINKSGFKRLAVFNGTKWSYWKPEY